MKSPLQKLRKGISALVLVFFSAVLAFHYLAGYDWMDALWMVVITISTVGYGEQSTVDDTTKMLSVLVILLGVTAAAYTFTGVIQVILQGEIDRMLGRRRMEKEINRLENHTVVCGFGKIGRILAGRLDDMQRDFLIIDSDPAKIESANELGYLAIEADATEEDCLRRARIESAGQIVVSLSTDAENVFVTLSARNMCPHIKIIAQAERESSFKKLRQAGADDVVRASQMVAQHMARLIARPSTANLVALLTESEHIDFELDELKVPRNCSMIGKSIAELAIRDQYALLVVAVKPDGDELIFNPTAHRKFDAGDTILIMGKANDIDRFRRDKGLTV
jgi:voltage-gated potassium channel